MALGFTSHYKPGEQTFGSLTQSSYNNDCDTSGTTSNLPSLIIGQDASLTFQNLGYDSCDFSSPVVIDYTQYAYVEGASVETAGSVASIFGVSDFSSGSSSSSVASFSSGGASFSGGGMSSASFTC